jgi:hypothetical protein
MKYSVLDNQRKKAIERSCTNNPEVWESKPEIMAAIETFTGNNTRIGELLAVLARPRSIIFRPKHNQLRSLRVGVSRMAGLGIILATSQQDESKAGMYKAYKLGAWRGTAWALQQKAMQIGIELEKEQEAISSVGLTPEKLADFKALAIEFGTTLETTDVLTKQITAARQELKSLVKSNNAILRLQLDPFANFVQELYPTFYREYKIARRSNIPRKPADSTEEMLTEITGTVTDSVTGEVIANATVDIADRGLIVITDMDGYFIFDEVPDGDYLLSCHATGYKLPDKVKATVVEGIGLEINFNLEPEAGE